MFKSILLALLVVITTLPVSAKEPAILSAQPVSATVGLYEKFELRIDLEATYDNPFDPAQVDVQTEFTAPSGKKLTLWGFYNPSQKSSPWMIRFAPTEKGAWQYVVKVKDKEGTAQSQVGSFTAADSSHHGFIQIAPNHRYLMYSDSTPFYGVGLWYNDSYERNRGSITESNLDDLKRRGGNFISFFPTPLETLNTGLGKYDESRCNRLDQVFEWCEQRDIHISWNVWFHSFISQAVWGGGNARYRENPYHLVTDATGFFRSDEAWKYEEKLHRYIIARWGYSRALFLWFIIDEINGTEGWEKGDHQVAEQWCSKMDAFFNEHDPYGRPTTGTQSGGIGQWWPGGYKILTSQHGKSMRPRDTLCPRAASSAATTAIPSSSAIATMPPRSRTCGKISPSPRSWASAAGSTPTTSPARRDIWPCTTTRCGSAWPTACAARRSGGNTPA
jgi:hypothetical protein